jgi:hypothetical protein
MFLIPPNYSFPLQLVSVFEWEPVARPAATPATPPAACEGTDAPMATADTPSSPPDLRLVFKGYEWRAVAERATFHREGWESVFCAEADAKDEERDPSAHHNEPTHHLAPPRPSHAVSNDIHATDTTPDKTDASEST